MYVFSTKRAHPKTLEGFDKGAEVLFIIYINFKDLFGAEHLCYAYLKQQGFDHLSVEKRKLIEDKFLVDQAIDADLAPKPLTVTPFKSLVPTSLTEPNMTFSFGIHQIERPVPGAELTTTVRDTENNSAGQASFTICTIKQSYQRSSQKQYGYFDSDCRINWYLVTATGPAAKVNLLLPKPVNAC